jgi:glucosyl-dolichyl phosphate glucuronosyltransferase
VHQPHPEPLRPNPYASGIPSGAAGGPSVTVCLCTRDSPGYVRLCLDSLQAQTVGPGGFDIVVVDSGSAADAAAELRRLVAAMPNARLLRLERPGLSLARNAGARAATGDYVAFIDDDAAAAPDWVERIQRAVSESDPPPAVLGGRVLPVWEAPLPAWWPASLRGVLTISEWEGGGEYRTAQVPAGLEPYGVNMVVERAALLAAGGFDESLGRQPSLLLSDEDVQLAWKLQQGGRSARHDARIVVHHRIQAGRLTPDWLLARLYWQGMSTVATRRLLGRPDQVWREFPRRLAVRLLCAPAAAMVPQGSTRLLALRWRHAYARGFTRMALGRHGRNHCRVKHEIQIKREHNGRDGQVRSASALISPLTKCLRITDDTTY